jgi:hypothetical protein
VDIQHFRPVEVFGHRRDHWLPGSVDQLLDVAAGGGIIVSELDLVNDLVFYVDRNGTLP